jgi:hypothetical protein
MAGVGRGVADVHGYAGVGAVVEGNGAENGADMFDDVVEVGDPADDESMAAAGALEGGDDLRSLEAVE